MSPALLILLHLSLVLEAQAPADQALGANIPSEPPALAAPPPPPALTPGAGAGPRLKSIGQSPLQPILLGEPVWLQAAPFTVVLTGLIPQADHVVAYLDGHRVGSALATAHEFALLCEEAVIPKQGYLLRIWVFRDGAAAIPLPPVVVHFRPRRGIEEAVPEPEPVPIAPEQLPAPRPVPPVPDGGKPVNPANGKPGDSRQAPSIHPIVHQAPPPFVVLDEPRTPAPVPPREPFARTPSVDPVPQAGTVTGQAESGKDGGIAERFYHPGQRGRDWWGSPDEGKASQKFKCHYFELPAHFPLRQFSDTYNVPAPDAEGVVIHEGMRIYFAADGRYEVQFAATTPAMMAMLRIQLLVSYKGIRPGDAGYFPLTLPPIRIEPDRDGPGHPETWQVRHVGYSREVQRHFCDLSEVQRSGAARLGSFPRWRTDSSRGSGY